MSFLAPWNWPGLLARVTGLEHVGEDDDDYMEIDDDVDNVEDDDQGGSEVDEEIEGEVGFLGLGPNVQLFEDDVDVDPLHQRLNRRLSAEVRRANAEFEVNYAPARDEQGKRSSKVHYDGIPQYRSPETSPKVPSALRQVLAPLRPSLKPQFGAPSAIHPRIPRGLRRRRSSAPTADGNFDINAPLNLNSPFATFQSSMSGSPKGPPRASIPPSPRSARTLSPTAPRPRLLKAPSIKSPVYISDRPAANSSRRAVAPKRFPPRSPLETPRPPEDSPNRPVEHSPNPINTIKGTSLRSDYHSASSSPSSPIKPALSSPKSANATQGSSRRSSYHTARYSLSSPSTSKTHSPTSSKATQGSSPKSSAASSRSAPSLTALHGYALPSSTDQAGLLEDSSTSSPNRPSRFRDAVQLSSRRLSYHAARSSISKSPKFAVAPLEVDTAEFTLPRSGPSASNFAPSPKHSPTESPPHPARPLGPDKTFEEIYEGRPPSPYPRTPRQTPRSNRVHKSSFKDYRVRKVDPLRYRNKLDQPHRLPDTPTKSHLPPSPRRKGPKKNACETCGRAFRVTKKKGDKAGMRSRTNAAANATAVVAAPAVEGAKRSGRVRSKTKKFGT